MTESQLLNPVEPKTQKCEKITEKNFFTTYTAVNEQQQKTSNQHSSN